LEIARGRTPLGAFETKEIRLNKDVISLIQVVRLWYMDAVSNGPIITISFMKTGTRGALKRQEYEVVGKRGTFHGHGSFILKLNNVKGDKAHLQLSTLEHLTIQFKGILGKYGSFPRIPISCFELT
jgi:hypothetical protein